MLELVLHPLAQRQPPLMQFPSSLLHTHDSTSSATSKWYGKYVKDAIACDSHALKRPVRICLCALRDYVIHEPTERMCYYFSRQCRCYGAAQIVIRIHTAVVYISNRCIRRTTPKSLAIWMPHEFFDGTLSEWVHCTMHNAHPFT